MIRAETRACNAGPRHAYLKDLLAEIKGPIASHVVMISHPDAVEKLIENSAAGY